MAPTTRSAWATLYGGQLWPHLHLASLQGSLKSWSPPLGAYSWEGSDSRSKVRRINAQLAGLVGWVGVGAVQDGAWGALTKPFRQVLTAAACTRRVSFPIV